MTIYTMGFTQKSAKVFFELIKKYEIQLLVDVRLNNQSQLAGFTKGSDLAYFVPEICQCAYEHDAYFAPTKEILDAYKKGQINWDGYVERFMPLIEKRGIAKVFENKYGKYDRVLLLCSEPTPECCHRRLVAEYIQANCENIEIMHI